MKTLEASLIDQLKGIVKYLVSGKVSGKARLQDKKKAGNIVVQDAMQKNKHHSFCTVSYQVHCKSETETRVALQLLIGAKSDSRTGR